MATGRVTLTAGTLTAVTFATVTFAALTLCVAIAALVLSTSPTRARAQPPTELPAGREPADPANLTPEERRHVPVLVLPQTVRGQRPFDFVAQIGLQPHVMTASHHIEWVEVFVGPTRVFRAELTPSVGYPIVRIPLVLDHTAELTVRAHCNLHGTWRTHRTIATH